LRKVIVEGVVASYEWHLLLRFLGSRLIYADSLVIGLRVKGG
jgi:hypothetical protein